MRENSSSLQRAVSSSRNQRLRLFLREEVLQTALTDAEPSLCEPDVYLDWEHDHSQAACLTAGSDIWSAAFHVMTSCNYRQHLWRTGPKCLKKDPDSVCLIKNNMQIIMFGIRCSFWSFFTHPETKNKEIYILEPTYT